MVLDPITPVLNFIQNKLWDPIVLRVSYVSDAGRHVENMTHSMTMLWDLSKDNMNRASDAKAGGHVLAQENEIFGWKRRVEELQAQVETIQVQFVSRRECLWSCHPNIISSYKIGKRAARKSSDISDRLVEGRNLNFQPLKAILAVAVRRDTAVAVGMESQIEKVQDYILDNKTRIVGIHGMGGVGKTTLLRNINNMFVDNQMSKFFDHVIMVDAKPGFNIKQLQKIIAERIGAPWSEEAEIGSRAIQILNCLNNKNLLLFLDNLWEPMTLNEEAGIPSEPKKCKIVISVRDKSILASMNVLETIQVKCLSDFDNEWKLFEQRVGNLDNDPEIKELAKSIVKKCRGLPLALSIVGAAMSGGRGRQHWQRALELMNSMGNFFDEMMNETDLNELTRILQLSYERLSAELKLCFLSCSFYPEGHHIPKDELIECWMGLGLLERQDDINKAYGRGYFLIGELLKASLLEPVYDENHVKMHDIVRVLVLRLTPQMERLLPSSAADSTSQKCWVVRAGEGLKTIPQVQGSVIERMSLMHNKIVKLPENADFPILLSLMLQRNVPLTGVLPGGFFGGMKCLKYLDLSDTSIKEVNGIEQLIYLEYLNLSGTHIRKLPQGLRLMTKLKYFYLARTNYLGEIPYGLLSRLHNLRVFNVYESYYKFWVTDGSANEASLNELEELKDLKALGISIETHDALEKIFSSLLIPTRYLYVSLRLQSGEVNCVRLQLPSTIHGSSMIDTSLLELTIKSCQDLEELMIGEEEKTKLGNISRGHGICFLKALENLYLQGLENLSRITWKGVTPSEYLPRLRLLSIVGCQKLNHVTWVLQLPHLVKLHISDCCGMQQVIAVGGNASYFPMLKAMNLINLPELTNICQHTLAFPYLESLHVSGCSNLTSLPFGEQSCSRLREIRGNREWWNKLNWASEDINKSFSIYFQEAAS